MTDPLDRDAHHERCTTQWYTMFDDPVGADHCPTCAAHRAIDHDLNIYDPVILAEMNAGHGWTREHVGTRWTPERMQHQIDTLEEEFDDV